MSLVQINDVLHSIFQYLLISVLIATELLSNEILAANGIVYRLCILKNSTVNLIVYKIYVYVPTIWDCLSAECHGSFRIWKIKKLS